METEIKQVLKETFGHTSFRKGQYEAIESVLSGKDTLVMLPTGTGKSLCYQLPGYLMDETVLVVSPLLSLMQDQVDNMRLRGEKRVVAINSLTSFSERQRIFRQISKYKFIYTSPEMLQNEQVVHYLKQINIGLFVVDEAHCISHWGTDFRPDYLALAEIRKQLNSPRTMALTATATKRVCMEIIEFLGLDFQQTKQIIEPVDREEIKFHVEICEKDKEEKLMTYLKQLSGLGIIYFTSKSLADSWAKKIRDELQIQTSSYHSDLEADDRIKIQQQFLINDLQIICATSAFGMGFDKKDIRFVIHFHLPSSPEMYLQEIGRASRDKQVGLAILLYEPGDEQIQYRFIESSLPSKIQIQQVFQGNTNAIKNEDPLMKLANYYKESSNDLNETLEKIEDRRQIKINQLTYMLQYIYTEKCKRNFLLNYFDESKNEGIVNCCGNCGLDFDKIYHLFRELSEFQEQKILKKDLESWQIAFNALYNIQ